MKVYIGPYKYWYGPYQLAKHILFWMDKEDERVDKLGTWLSENKKGEERYLTKFCYWLSNKNARKIKVRIDPWDTWGMDTTLSHIVLPMLKQLKATKHGSPFVDNEDLPPELQMSERETYLMNYGVWNEDKTEATEEEMEAVNKKFFSGWDWVMDQMIYSFEQQFDEEEGRNNYYDPYLPGEEVERMKEHIIGENGEVTEDPNPLFDEKFMRKMGKFNKEKYHAYAAKKQLGFTLFGKYFQSLWD